MVFVAVLGEDHHNSGSNMSTTKIIEDKSADGLLKDVNCLTFGKGSELQLIRIL